MNEQDIPAEVVKIACVAYVDAGGYINGKNRLGVEGPAMAAALAAAYPLIATRERTQAADRAEAALKAESDRLAWATDATRGVEQGIGAAKAINAVQAAILDEQVAP